MKTAAPSLSPGTQVSLHGQAYRVQGVDTDGDGTVRLTHLEHGHSIRLSMAELGNLRLRGQFRALTENPAPVDLAAWRLPLKRMTEEQKAKAGRRIAYVNALRSFGALRPMNPLLVATVNEVAQRLKDPAPPSPHTVYRWRKRYIDSGLDTRVFLRDAGAFHERAKRVPEAVTTALRGHLEALLSETEGATVSGVMNEALALTARDTGFVTFVDRNGNEHFVQEFLADLQRDRIAKAAEDGKAKPLGRGALRSSKAEPEKGSSSGVAHA